MDKNGIINEGADLIAEDVENPPAKTTENDGNIIATVLKTLDVNRYATKKTIAQGLLDFALLTANATQLKYVLEVGEKHQFYILMMILLISSIVLQVIQGIICFILGTRLDINKPDEQFKADKVNNTVVAINVIIVALNIIISVFEGKDTMYLNNK